MVESSLRVAFVGAGRVGRSFGMYLQFRGISVEGYASRSGGALKQAVKDTGSRTLSLEEIPAVANMIFITTPDDQIQRVTETMAREVGFSPGHTVVHMSGGLASDILLAARGEGAKVFSLHPLQSFANPYQAVKVLPRTFFTLEGTGDPGDIVYLLDNLGNPYIEISSNKKTEYHGAAAIASNYLVTLVALSAHILEDCGFDQGTALQVVTSLMDGTLENVRTADTVQALTGPIARGDVGTVSKHLEAFDKVETRGGQNLGDLYRLLGRETLEVAVQKDSFPEEQVRALRSLLEDR